MLPIHYILTLLLALSLDLSLLKYSSYLWYLCHCFIQALTLYILNDIDFDFPLLCFFSSSFHSYLLPALSLNYYFTVHLPNLPLFNNQGGMLLITSLYPLLTYSFFTHYSVFPLSLNRSSPWLYAHFFSFTPTGHLHLPVDAAERILKVFIERKSKYIILKNSYQKKRLRWEYHQLLKPRR